MSRLKIFISTLGYFFSQYGGWGLFAISFLDSSFLAFPVINDLLLIKLASSHPHKTILYVLQCTAGSVLGACTLYFISQKGRNFFWRNSSSQREKTLIRHWIERNDFISILVASLLPPPMPFKIFAIIAGGLQIDVTRFITALIIGRGLRFSVEGWLGAYYGVAAQQYLKNNIEVLSIIVVVLIVAVAVVYRYLKRRFL